MTEAEWLGCTDPSSMVKLLRGKVSDRKLRLFACACCRRIWTLLTHEDAQECVRVAECFADNLATKNGLRVARKRAMRVQTATPVEQAAVAAAASVSFKSSFGAAFNSHLHAMQAEARCRVDRVAPANLDAYLQAMQQCSEAVAALLPEIMGYPFRPVTLHPSWLTATVTGLAETIYQERAFDRLPILADALEEVGCTDAEILGHCRGPGPHVRGCWVVDLLLGKE